ncbi:hypothetical protein MMC10_007066 [Thelotrema lepadinum]|nr:hypothetical protein [Thelotrema lepadinum]
MGPSLCKLTTAALFLTSISAAPSPAQDSNANDNVKRQQTAPDYSQLLQVASEAGVPIPTDNPALLLSIAPIAAELNSVLPTAPVLSVLETAVPSGFLSNVIHDPSYAASFLSEFEAGSSPSWFLALPTDVRSYLHTYNNYGSVATAVGGIASVESVANSQSISSVSASISASMASASASGSVSGSTAMSSSATGSMASSTGGTTGSMSGSSSGASAAATGSSTGASSASSSAGAAAARETGALAAGAMAMAGILGLAVAL